MNNITTQPVTGTLIATPEPSNLGAAFTLTATLNPVAGRRAAHRNHPVLHRRHSAASARPAHARRHLLDCQRYYRSRRQHLRCRRPPHQRDLLRRPANSPITLPAQWARITFRAARRPRCSISASARLRPARPPVLSCLRRPRPSRCTTARLERHSRGHCLRRRRAARHRLASTTSTPAPSGPAVPALHASHWTGGACPASRRHYSWHFGGHQRHHWQPTPATRPTPGRPRLRSPSPCCRTPPPPP